VNRYAATLFALAVSGGCALRAQAPPSFVAEQKAAYTAVKNNLIRAAEKMPEENYGFKPAPEIRSFGELIAHIAGQARACAMIRGGQRVVEFDMTKTAKADLVAVLKTSFEECDAAWDAMNDTTAKETMAGRGGPQTKLSMLIARTITHENEEYGYLAVYMRLKGVVPPSSER
jgi:hypothetical protein